MFLAIAHVKFSVDELDAVIRPGEDIAPLAKIWQEVNDQLTNQSSRKFVHQLDQLLTPQQSYSTPCKVCHCDDVPEQDLQPLNKREPNSVLACSTCRAMFELGDRLPDITAFVRSSRQYHEDDLAIQSVFYHPVSFKWKPNPGDIVFQINNWCLNQYSSEQFIPMLLGNYARRLPKDDEPEKNRFITAGEMASESKGIERVGYLRMDVDRLSQIFSKGLGAAYTLPRLASLSRQMTYFFKVYLNSLAEHRATNFSNLQNPDGTPRFTTLSPHSK